MKVTTGSGKVRHLHTLSGIVAGVALAMASVANARIASNGQIAARALVKPAPNYVTPAVAGDTIADRVLGQFDLFHATENFVDAESLATNTTTAFAGIAVDTSSLPNRVYVADQVNNRVLGWSSVQALTNNRPADIEIGQPDFFTATCLPTPNNASLCAPGGVAVDGSGNVYVADTGNNRVLEYNSPLVANGLPGSGDRIADEVFGQSDSFTTNLCNLGAPAGVTNAFGLCGPQGVALDSMGNLYVADTKNNRVLEYNFPSVNDIASHVFGQAGSFTTVSANKGGLSANGLSGPAGIALDSLDDLWVADSNNNRVLEYNSPLTNTIANKVVGQGSFITNTPGTTQNTLSRPISIDFDTGNNLFVADDNNNRVLEYNNPIATSGAFAAKVIGQGGVFTTKTANFGGLGAKGLFLPSGVALDGANNLYVKDSFNNRLLKYNAPVVNGSIAALVLGQPDFTHNAANEIDGGVLFGPNGVTIDTTVSPPRIWVADTLNNRVLGFNNAATFKNGAQADLVLGQKDFTGVDEDGGGATPASGFDEPYGVAVDKIGLGHLYVLDSAHDRVLGYKLPITSNGQAPNMVFGAPDFVTASCNYTGAVSNKGMCFPQGIAVDGNGNLFVGDTGNNRVMEYNAPFNPGNDNLPDHVFGQPDFVSAGCSFPPTSSSLCSPAGVAADASNNIYIVDSGANRVVEYNTPLTTNLVADKVFGQPNFVSANGNATASLMNFPTGVAVDSLGEVYVVDAGNQRMLGFKTQLATGNVATIVFGQFGSFTSTQGNFGGGPSPYSLDNPNGVAVDPSNNVYVTDAMNNRVLAYNSPFAVATPVPQPMTVTPPSLNFNKVNKGTISTAQTLVVKNTGTAPILFNGASRSGGNINDFAQSNNCIGSLAAGASCTLTVKFGPTAAGGSAESTTLKIWSNAAGSPKLVPLSGVSATDPAVSPTSLPFGSITKGTTSAAKTVTVTNSQTAAITVSSVIGGNHPGDFAKSATTCGATLAGGASCTVSVTFKPTVTGARAATLIVTTGSDPASPHNVALTGTGT
jgi:sugar lactone lactonase YvrE